MVYTGGLKILWVSADTLLNFPNRTQKGYVTIGYGHNAADGTLLNQFKLSVYPTKQMASIELIKEGL